MPTDPRERVAGNGTAEGQDLTLPPPVPSVEANQQPSEQPVTGDGTQEREFEDPESDLFEGLYDREWRRRDQLQSAISTPFALLSALAGGVFYIFQQGMGHASVQGGWRVLFGIGLSVSALCLIVALGTLLCSFVGHDYQSVPPGMTLWRYRHGLRVFHAEEGARKSPEGDAAFARVLAKRYALAADLNHLVNNRRAEWLHRSHIAIIIALPFLGLAAVPVALQTRSTLHATSPVVSPAVSPSNAGRAPTQSLEDRTMTDSKDSSNTRPAQPAPTSEKTPPVLPPNHMIKGGTDHLPGGKGGKGGGQRQK